MLTDSHTEKLDMPRHAIRLALPLAAGLALATTLATAGAAQDTALTRLLVANRHPVALSLGALTGAGGRLLVDSASHARFVLLGEEHGIAETPRLMQAMLCELRTSGFDTFAIEVSPLQGERLDGMARKPAAVAALNAMIVDWRTAPPFYSVREERDLLASAMTAQCARPPMRIWGLDYDVSADRYFLEELEKLAPKSGRDAVHRAHLLADSGFAAVKQGNPSKFFAWSAPDSVFDALRAAFGPTISPRARAIIDVFARTARINRLFLSGDGYQSNLLRSAYLRENFAREFAQAGTKGTTPRVVFKFGGSHMMRGFNTTNTLDIGTAADVYAEARGERAYHVLVLGGSGTKAARMNIMKLQYEPMPSGEIDGANLAWLKPAVPDSGWVVFDMQAARGAWLRRRGPVLTPMQDRFVHAYDAIVVLTGSTPGTPVPLAATP